MRFFFNGIYLYYENRILIFSMQGIEKYTVFLQSHYTPLYQNTFSEIVY